MKILKTYIELFESNELVLSNKKLTELPELPSTLTKLFCEYNNLTELPDLPKTLTHLDCSNNQLTELPDLPKTLKTLLCDGNNLPYTDLDGYWEWYYNVKYPKKGLARKYNIYRT